MQRCDRRTFLATAGLAASATLAGCLGGSSSGASPGDPGDAAPGDGLRLSTVAVAGSPGGPVNTEPPDQTVLLDFFATWCAPCKPQMKFLREVRDSFPDLHVLSVTWEEDESLVREFWREYDGTWPVATDPEARSGERYGATRIPTLLVLAPDGEEAWRHVGLADADAIAAAVEEAR